MLQAFINDSKQHQDVLVLAGYLGHWKRWEQFSVEWQKLLDENHWDEFKMARAARFPERAERFYGVIKDHVAAYVACVLEIGALRKICDELALPPFCRNPYNFGIKAILDSTYGELARVGSERPIEFIFDERGEKVHLQAAWEFFLIGRTPQVRRLIYGEPRFERSSDTLPLQSAEIIAWHAREHWIKHRKFEESPALLWNDPEPIKGHLVHWDYDGLKPNMESLRKLLADWDSRYLPVTPG